MPAECCKEFWGKIPDDEPVFTIAGRDLLALPTIDEWIRVARNKGVNPDKIARAERHYEAIKKFQKEHKFRCHLPD